MSLDALGKKILGVSLEWINPGEFDAGTGMLQNPAYHRLSMP